MLFRPFPSPDNAAMMLFCLDPVAVTVVGWFEFRNFVSCTIMCRVLRLSIKGVIWPRARAYSLRREYTTSQFLRPSKSEIAWTTTNNTCTSTQRLRENWYEPQKSKIQVKMFFFYKTRWIDQDIASFAAVKPLTLYYSTKFIEFLSSAQSLAYSKHSL